MNFNELKSHLEDNACGIDPLEEKLHVSRNCINGKTCLIEELDFYSIGTLAHYFYELNIDIPEHLEDAISIYTNWREYVKGKGFVKIEK